MKYDMTTPCNDCPFRREGGLRIDVERVKEIAGLFLVSGGGTFACHKTTGACGNNPKEERHCAGALIFAEKNGNANQMMRIMERLRMYDHTKLTDRESVFSSLKEMLKANRGLVRRKRKAQPTT